MLYLYYKGARNPSLTNIKTPMLDFFQWRLWLYYGTDLTIIRTPKTKRNTGLSSQQAFLEFRV